MPKTKAARSELGETIIVDETRLAPFQVRVRTGSSTFFVDEPIGEGGVGSGPNPYDLMSAAIGSCSALTVRSYAVRKKWPLDRVQIRVTHVRIALHSRDLFVKEVCILGALIDAQRAKLLEVSARSPVHLSLERAFDVKTVLLSSPMADDRVVTRGHHARDMAAACER